MKRSVLTIGDQLARHSAQLPAKNNSLLGKLFEFGAWLSL